MSRKTTYDLFEPDKHNLDIEWTKQPRLYAEHADKLADARADLDRAKAELEVVEAELKLDIRRRPEKYGVEKLTEDTVKSVVPLQRQYKVAQDKVFGAKHKVDILSGYQTALDHRKKALESLLQLFLADYYSKPHLPKGSTRDAVGGQRNKSFAYKGEQD